MDELIQLNIKGISYSQTQSGAYALILEEESGDRKLPIVIGSFEAQSIALALEKDIRPPRPLTHDLFATVAEEFQLSIQAVHIYKLEDGVFFSNILFIDYQGNKKPIDSRTSDAIAMAVRFQSPIFAFESVMEKAGIYLDESREEVKRTEKTIEEIEGEVATIENKPTKGKDWQAKSIQELEKLMHEAVENEDYELAARLRDELDNRKNN